jgi:predicted amidohydrolase
VSDSSRFVVAAVQAAPSLFDRDRTIAKAVALISEAAGNGARLVAFPEAWVTGYPVWIYGAAGWDDPRAKRVHGRFLHSAVTVPSPATDALCAAAERFGVEVCIGINERDSDASTGTIYNSILFIGSDGGLRGSHRKLVPTHAERIVWGQGDGSTLHVLPTAVGRLGGLVCWEHWMPLVRFAMHAKAEQVHVAVWPEAVDVEHLASRHYAFEGRCFVLCVGGFLRIDDLPDGFELVEALEALGAPIREDGVLFRGGSGVIGPDGQWIVGPAGCEETIVYAEIDLSKIAEEQQTFDAAGHYNRPDVFQVTIDERPHRQVNWLPGRDLDNGIRRKPSVGTACERPSLESQRTEKGLGPHGTVGAGDHLRPVDPGSPS